MHSGNYYQVTGDNIDTQPQSLCQVRMAVIPEVRVTFKRHLKSVLLTEAYQGC